MISRVVSNKCLRWYEGFSRKSNREKLYVSTDISDINIHANPSIKITSVGEFLIICVGGSHSLLFYLFYNHGLSPIHVVELSCLKVQSFNAKHWPQIIQLFSIVQINYHLHVYMNISTYHVHTCIKVTSILTILYLLIYITSLI